MITQRALALHVQLRTNDSFEPIHFNECLKQLIFPTVNSGDV